MAFGQPHGHPHPQRRGHPAVRECAEHRAQQTVNDQLTRVPDRRERHRVAGPCRLPRCRQDGHGPEQRRCNLHGLHRQQRRVVGFPTNRFRCGRSSRATAQGGTFPLIWHEIMTAAMSWLEPNRSPPAGFVHHDDTARYPRRGHRALLLGQEVTEEFMPRCKTSRITGSSSAPTSKPVIPPGMIICRHLRRRTRARRLAHTIEVAVPPEVFRCCPSSD